MLIVRNLNIKFGINPHKYCFSFESKAYEIHFESNLKRLLWLWRGFCTINLSRGQAVLMLKYHASWVCLWMVTKHIDNIINP